MTSEKWVLWSFVALLLDVCVFLTVTSHGCFLVKKEEICCVSEAGCFQDCGDTEGWTTGSGLNDSLA